MRAFRDVSGREWHISLDVSALRRVRSLSGVDLMDLVGGDLALKLQRDPILLADVIYACCQPEASSRGVSDDDFGRALRGDAIADACRALLEELVDFFPSTAARSAARKVVDLSIQASEMAAKEMERRIEELDLGAMISGATSTVAPGSSESIQDRSPTGSS